MLTNRRASRKSLMDQVADLSKLLAQVRAGNSFRFLIVPHRSAG